MHLCESKRERLRKEKHVLRKRMGSCVVANIKLKQIEDESKKSLQHRRKLLRAKHPTLSKSRRSSNTIQAAATNHNTTTTATSMQSQLCIRHTQPRITTPSNSRSLHFATQPLVSDSNCQPLYNAPTHLTPPLRVSDLVILFYFHDLILMLVYL
ncbi:unnamed protein product [Vicia faba]|uniref:Uncharacterized protein n=1 Tax=Vicia faba TaxID=3906 RepID=A0AAV1AFW4_VICFA|nr:unnamed protein product [Vicia faba]